MHAVMQRILPSHLALAILIGAALLLASWAREEPLPTPGPRPNFERTIGLRDDPARKTSVSSDLAQFDEVRDTLRTRVSAVWQPVRYRR